MKSEKAKKMIENGKHVLSIADKVFIHSQEGVDKDVAESAVEIAEAEMREKAIETFKWLIVEYYADINDKKLIDKHIQKFTQQLDKQE